MIPSFPQRLALLAGGVVLLGTAPASANAQKALVYCPVTVDATGCTTIVTALAPAYPLGVDRGYDGTDGTVDLATVDLFKYTVFVVPSLADDATAQPYAKLRDPEVVEHLKAALIGRIALWSGSPDQGATNRAMKDALIQNLASYAAGAYATAKGPGLVALLDASPSIGTRYDWLRAITPLEVTSDPNILIYNSVRALNPLGTSILTSGLGLIAYTNMATFGFQVPNGAPGISLDAVGQTGTTIGGQVVLATIEAGNSGGALVKTDKDDYAPGETVTITGSGWQSGEQVRLTLHVDPVRDSDIELTATADGNGNFVDTSFAPADYDLGVRFILTAMGLESGRRAQATFTDGNRVTFSTTAAGAVVTNFGTVTQNQCVSAFVQERQGSNIDDDGHAARTVNLSSMPSGATFYGAAGCAGAPITSVIIAANTSAAAFWFAIGSNGTFTINGDAGLPGSNNASASVTVSGVAAPNATDDAYSINEDQSLNIGAPGVLSNDVGAGTLTAVIVSPPPVAEGIVTLNPDGGFNFTPAQDFFGSTSFTYRAQNSGGLSATATVSITVNPVNDAPTFTLIDGHTSNEDAGPQSVANALTAKAAGPANENGQTLMLAVSNDNPALFTAQPAIDAAGTLTYTVTPDASGTATVTVLLSDDGGTADGGIDQTTKTLLITVNPVNDAPSFSEGADQSVNEDAGAQTINGWATGISAGPADESAQALTFTITGNSNAGLFSAGPAVAANGTLTYTAAPDANGTATITLKLTDNGGTANGGVDASGEQSFTITVNAVNDAPTFTKGADQTVLEDAGAQTVASWPTAITAGPADEAGQTLTFGVTNDNTALFAVQPSIAADGTLSYTPADNAYGSAIVTVTLTDNGGTANGGVESSAPQMFTIALTPVNDAPSFAKGADQSVNEDAGPQSVSNWATAITAGPNESQALTFVVSSDNPSLFAAGPSVSATGTLTYTPAPNANGSATVTVILKDDGATANGGVDQSGAETFTISVGPVNDAPSFAKGADQTVLEDAGAQTVPGWATNISAGPDDEEGQALTFNVTANSNPGLFATQPTVDPATGTLTYTPAANAYGSATITLTLSDDGGTANGGVDTSAPQMFVINVTPVNDAPSFSKGADQTVNEDAGAQSVPGWATSISAGLNEATQIVDFLVSSDNPALFAVQPAVSSTGQLTYTPALNANGTATVTVRIHDDGGTANGGVDTSAPQTFEITVNPVNDAPSFTKGPDQTVNEDAGAQTIANWATGISAGPSDEVGQSLTFIVSNDKPALFSEQPSIAANGTLTYTAAPDAFGTATVTVRLQDNGGTAFGGVDTSDDETFTIVVNAVNDAPSFVNGADQILLEDSPAQSVSGWATAISAGPANESGQTLTFHVTGNTNPALFAAPPAVSSSGTLTYTLAQDAFGTATITLHVQDDGGTAFGGDDTSDPQTFTIDVTPVNDAPTFDLIASHSVLEDAGGQSVASALTNPSAGPANESSQALSLTVTNDNNALFSAQPAIDLATGTLTYTPAGNANGTATVTVKLMDDGGTADGGVDATTKTLVITVTAVNDEPTFTKGADQTTLEDAGPQVVSGWASAISAGPPDESGQALTFLVSNSNNELFETQPAIASNGQLTYTAASNANGMATVTVKLMDDGGTANGGANTSAEETFTITITPVNDAPTFAKGADQLVLEDGGAQTVANWATAITAGPSDEASQSLTFTAMNDNNALFSVQPSIDPTTGTLTYTPAANANGLATVTVTLEDDGGTANGGVDQSVQTFTVSITAVNDEPSFVKGADQTVLEDAGSQAVNGWATAISAGPPDESTQMLTFVVTGNTNPGLFSTPPAIDPTTGALTYTPAADANGSATITVELRDNGGTANGGDDTSPSQTFEIAVTAVNDAPLYTLIASETSAEDAGPQSVPGAVTGMSVGPANESSQTLLSLTATNNNTALFSVQPSIDLATGTLTYTAAPNANGTATVTVTLKDDGGIANGGVDQTTKTFTLTITKVNDAPVINDFSGPVAPTAVITSVSVVGNFTDVDLGDIPVTESHTVTIDWGDGDVTPVVPSGAGTTRSISASHTYASAGVYTTTLTVTDASGQTAQATYQYIVVYDPNAGFVTGGGWINSPAGACRLTTCTYATIGKANFGFVAKYQKGQTKPSGDTEFQFHAGDINFKSKAYEWLVINGTTKAQYKGTGTINGAGNYGFMLSVVDGDGFGNKKPDTFRIKIWDIASGDVVYDNNMYADDLADPTTTLGGGSIQIKSK